MSSKFHILSSPSSCVNSCGGLGGVRVSEKEITHTRNTHTHETHTYTHTHTHTHTPSLDTHPSQLHVRALQPCDPDGSVTRGLDQRESSSPGTWDHKAMNHNQR